MNTHTCVHSTYIYTVNIYINMCMCCQCGSQEEANIFLVLQLQVVTCFQGCHSGWSLAIGSFKDHELRKLQLPPFPTAGARQQNVVTLC